MSAVSNHEAPRGSNGASSFETPAGDGLLRMRR